MELAISTAVAGVGVVHIFEGMLRPYLDSGALEPILNRGGRNFRGRFSTIRGVGICPRRCASSISESALTYVEIYAACAPVRGKHPHRPAFANSLIPVLPDRRAAGLRYAEGPAHRGAESISVEAQFRAVHHRHHPVRNNQVGNNGAHAGHRLGTVARAADLITLVFKNQAPRLRSSSTNRIERTRDRRFKHWMSSRLRKTCPRNAHWAIMTRTVGYRAFPRCSAEQPASETQIHSSAAYLFCAAHAAFTRRGAVRLLACCRNFNPAFHHDRHTREPLRKFADFSSAPSESSPEQWMDACCKRPRSRRSENLPTTRRSSAGNPGRTLCGADVEDLERVESDARTQREEAWQGSLAAGLPDRGTGARTRSCRSCDSTFTRRHESRARRMVAETFSMVSYVSIKEVVSERDRKIDEYTGQLERANHELTLKQRLVSELYEITRSVVHDLRNFLTRFPSRCNWSHAHPPKPIPHWRWRTARPPT